MNIDDILDAMDEMLDRAWNLPLTGGRCVVDAEKVRDLIDDIRLNMPAEIKQAKQIVADRTDIISVAKKRQRILSARQRNMPKHWWSKRKSPSRLRPVRRKS